MGVRLPVVSGADLPSDLAASVVGAVRFGRHDRMLYATDASIYQVEPVGVVIPATVDDAVRAVRVCARHGAAVLPRGGGTSLAGQCTARAVVIDFSVHCRSLLRVDAAARRCAVEPGITVDELNRALAPTGLFFAPDPATSRQCNIGGCIGNNAAGARSIRYGRTSENVAAIDACLADGTRVRFGPGSAREHPRVEEITRRVVEITIAHADLIRQRFPRTPRRNAGYALDDVLTQIDRAGSAEAAVHSISLAPLLCGSEGTLAVTLGAELILHPVPRLRGLAIASFADLDAALDAVVPIVATGPTAVELLDDVVLHAASVQPGFRRYLDALPPIDGRTPSAVLMVEYVADEPGGLDRAMEGLSSAVGGVPVVRCSARQANDAWALRKAGEPLLHGLPGHRKPLSFVEDNAVPVDRLKEFVHGFKEICRRHGTHAAYWAHASVGVLHIRPMLDLRDPEDERRMHRIAEEAADLARACGGVMSGEHGDGRVRSPLLPRQFGPELMAAFRAVKRAFDPRNLLNPGNIVEPGPIESISQRTRIRPGASAVDTVPVPTWHDFTDQDGFRGAVERCNGSGVCRKRAGGVMCPSYMATLDERHSTRGRANALRLAATGQLPIVWNDPETLQTLDLCLSCKACKSECPSGVDVARLKAEYLAQSYRAGRPVPLSASAIAHVRTLNRLAGLAPRLAGAATRGMLGTALRRVLDVHPARSLPGVHRPPRWRCRPDGRPVVAVLADCFTTWNEPDILGATRAVLEALGYRPVLVDAGCCARPMISLGLLDAARETIAATSDRLVEALDRHGALAVVCLEPSCLSAIVDDWRALRMPVPASLIERATTLEGFVMRRWRNHPVRPEPARGAGRVVLHAHCHQKALWGAAETAEALARLAGADVETPDTTCCGMAGSFGMSRRRYELSMRIGELSVFPACRDAQRRGATVCATGTSCRHQILDGTGVRAVHPAQVLAGALRPRR